MSVILRNRHLLIDLSPDYGGRVTRLIDVSSDRDWMVPGSPSPRTGQDAAYGVNEAVGWDECFPTVARWDGVGTVWNRTLRDHGEIWGRPMEIDSLADDRVTLVQQSREYRFERTLRLDGPRLHADYVIENRLSEPLPALWALHALLAVRPGDRLILPGINRFSAAFMAMNGREITVPAVDWPRGDPRLGFPLDIVPEPNGFMAKFYAKTPVSARAFVGGPDRWLGIGWNGTTIGHLGFWLTYGGWPAPGPGSVHHLAIEPTTASADTPDATTAGEPTLVLAPGESRAWSVSFSVSDSPEPT